MPAPSSRPIRVQIAVVAVLVAAASVAAVLPPPPAGAAEAPPDHLVISEIVTGGASASDEIVELYNPTDVALPLEGLEVIYVSASGATVTRRASWAAGAPSIPPRHHLLLANDAGAFAPIADVLYAGGMAATGGSVAIRIIGASTAVDSVGWGTAASAWLEGTPATAPAPAESIERLPGGASGSTVDTDDNAADFVVRPVSDPQNLGSPPTPDPSAPPVTPAPTTPAPSVTPTPMPPSATPVPSSTPAASVPIATARALPDGTRVTIVGGSLTASDFGDGGGYVADDSGGIAVLVDGGTFARGRLLRVSGEIDDRFSQRTLRAAGGDILDLGPAADPDPPATTTGAVGEALEGRLVRVDAAIVGSASQLTTGTAFDLDDGSGPTRLVVGAATGIDVAGWAAGTRLELVAVVGQRDSTGSGTSGYRIQPRDPADVLASGPPASPSAGPSSSPAPVTPAPSTSPAPGTISVAEARALPKNTRVVVRGTVTLPTGVVDAQTAAIQDASGAIVLRLGDEAGTLVLGEVVEVSGTRSTKSGMETIRVTTAPSRLGTAAGPAPVTSRSGDLDESFEAELVRVRGGLVAAARRASSGTVSFEIDDGSGPIRVVAGSTLALDRTALVAGAWVEVTGVLGQETTGAQPDRGYRIWPRTASETRLLAAPTDGGEVGDDGSSGSGSDATPTLDDLATALETGAPVGATLVIGPWPELGVGGLLWDGERLVAIASADADRVEATLRTRRPPLALELSGLVAAGSHALLGIPVVALGPDVHAIVTRPGPLAPPAAAAPGDGRPPRWISTVGTLVGPARDLRLQVAGGTLELDRRCAAGERPPHGTVAVTGVARHGQPVVVPCGGIQPAPVLAREIAAELRASGTGHDRPTLAGATADRSVAGAIAAGLLGLGAVALAGVGAWIRLRAPGSTPDPVPDDVAADATDAGDPSAEAAPPILTLVRVPHERGP